MKTYRLARSSALLGALAAGILAALPGTAAAGKTVHEVQKAQVVVNLPLTVGGSFDAKTTELSGDVSVDPEGKGVLEGTLACDLKSLDTGIDLRNTHLRENYLEVGKGEGFDKARLSEIKIETPDPSTFQGKASFTAAFELHGVKKAVKGEATVKREGDVAHVEATFPISVADHQIKKPTYLGVGVKNDIKVKVMFDLAPGKAARNGGAQ